MRSINQKLSRAEASTGRLTDIKRELKQTVRRVTKHLGLILREKWEFFLKRARNIELGISLGTVKIENLAIKRCSKHSTKYIRHFFFHLKYVTVYLRFKGERKKENR